MKITWLYKSRFLLTWLTLLVFGLVLLIIADLLASLYDLFLSITEFFTAKARNSLRRWVLSNQRQKI